MKRGWMQQRCAELLSQLDALEGVLSYLPEDDKRSLYIAIRAVKELQIIAHYETPRRPTKPQIQDLAIWQAWVDCVVERLPKEAYHDDDED